jgi:hypothetical protein
MLNGIDVCPDTRCIKIQGEYIPYAVLPSNVLTSIGATAGSDLKLLSDAGTNRPRKLNFSIPLPIDAVIQPQNAVIPGMDDNGSMSTDGSIYFRFQRNPAQSTHAPEPLYASASLFALPTAFAASSASSSSSAAAASASTDSKSAVPTSAGDDDDTESDEDDGDDADDSNESAEDDDDDDADEEPPTTKRRRRN